MIFGDPYRFAIWVEMIPEWSDSYKNGFFYFFMNGNMYPDDIRTSTLGVDVYEIIDDMHPFVACPQNKEIFELPTEDAFASLFKLAYPESTEDDEYPEQLFDFYSSTQIINNSGAHFFAVANETAVRIIGGKTAQLVKNEFEDVSDWEEIENPLIEDITISKSEINKIIEALKTYSRSVLER